MGKNETDATTEETTKQYLTLDSEFEDWEGKTVSFSHRFAKPTKTMIERTNADIQKGKSDRALATLLLGLVHPDDKESLTAALQEFPGVKQSYSDRIYERLGYNSVGK